MGRATRWLKSLLGGRRESKGGGGRDNSDGVGGDMVNKKRWSFGKPARSSNSGEVVALGDNKQQQWQQRPYLSDSDKELSRRAIAVAAATAAAADSAVAAAQAAAVVVRLTSQGRGSAAAFAGWRERYAAVKIQAAFRGYLARKALRALRALVKLQALVRGYLVRRQAAEDLHRMQSLVRAQSALLSQRCRGVGPTRDRSRVHPDIRHRRSLERVDEARGVHTRSSHSRRLSASLDPGVNSSDDSPKIVEVDPGRPRSRTRRLLNPHPPTSSCDSSAAEDSSCSYYCKSSPLVCHIPPLRVSTPSLKNCPPDWSLPGDEYRFVSTAHNTPRVLNSTWAASVPGHEPVTPSKSVCGADAFRRYQAHHHLLLSNHPNYMATTESFTAKLRSLSAPRQRPEIPPLGPKKRAALYEIMESRASLSGIRMQRSCSQAQEIAGFRSSGTVGELSRELVEAVQRRW